MKYPNLTAEYEASGYHIDTLARRANVTVGLIRAALYGDEELQAIELIILSQLLCPDVHPTYNYIKAKKVSLIGMKTRRQHCEKLHELFIIARNEFINPDKHCERCLSKAAALLQVFKDGVPIRWADYRHCYENLYLCLGVARERQVEPRDISRVLSGVRV